MPTVYIVFISAGLLFLLLYVVYRVSSKPITTEEAKAHLDSYFTKLLHQSRQQTGLQVLVESKGFHYSFTAGSISAGNGATIAPNQPFHTASIGKVFTAVLIMKLAEQGQLSIHDPLTAYLPGTALTNLFVYKGTDYAEQVTLKQLLGHTSGVADYLEDPVSGSPAFLELLVSNPGRFWTPDQLVDFTRQHQQATGIPGTRYHYSDTGYILLGQIIEAVTGASFSANLHKEIFGPLQMDDSYLMFYSEPHNQPKLQIQDIWLNGTEISTYQSLSCDWAGGGIITTPKDLMIFQKKLRNGQLLRPDSLREMESFSHKFRTGLHYGLGMMEVRFEEFFFMLKGLPRLKGHIGILATHMFSYPDSDTHIVMNFGSTAAMVRSFKALIEIVNTLKKIRSVDI
ncbi:hypothetical protein GCM10010912_55180 [Paenibacillus albidus]|uniref:Beta-lactamase-related domain-containing protein n=1 Tax=Paenibacillus albidus TaxID=2041023 RepID=A0A917CXQ4_9BACL|nr:serine hydrolase domain-containing protein [Paenibacillus albidus]GGG03460.1 hypothetical protein GCM10010912_55180 [Paenibacillus albidus]